MNEFITSILNYPPVLWLISWLPKAWITERLKGSIQLEDQKTLEAVKAQLREMADGAVEQTKVSLQTAASEKNIRYSSNFERMEETASTAFQKLDEFFQALINYANRHSYRRDDGRLMLFEGADGPEAKRREFENYFLPRCHYLPNDTTKMLKDCFEELCFLTSQYGEDLVLTNDPSSSSYPRIQKWDEEKRLEIKKVKQDLMRIQDHLRALLGVNETTPLQNDTSP